MQYRYAFLTDYFRDVHMRENKITRDDLPANFRRSGPYVIPTPPRFNIQIHFGPFD